MFWGLIMEPKRRYMQEVKQSFHISMAALDVFACSDEPSQVLLNYDNRNYLLCTLEKDKIIQVPLDLNFEAGDTIAFATNGSSNVHLTGYVIEEEGEDEIEDGWQPESDEEVEDLKPEKESKRKKKQSEQTNNQPPKKKTKTEELLEQEYDSNDDESFSLSKYLNDEAEEEEDSNEDSDDDAEDEEGDDEAEDEEMSDQESDDEEVSSMSEDDEEQTEQPEVKMNGKQKKKKNTEADFRASLGSKNKTPNKQEQTPNKQQQQDKTPKKDKTPKQEKTPKENKTPKSETAAKSPNTQQAQSPLHKRTIEGGIVIQDLKVGEGQLVKPGKLVQVYYEGRLKQNNKMFDKCIQGQGFKFRLGKREVIRGWDIGVNGMKVGGKRRIVCPPSMAYGEKGSPPQIPPNSTLIFEVELKGCK